MTEFLLVLFVGLFAGVMTGLMGASGVVAVVPGMLLLGYPAQQAIGTSLAVDSLASLVVAATYYHHNRVNIAQGAGIAAAAVVGAQAGSRLSVYVPEYGISSGFGLVMILTAWVLWNHSASSNMQRMQKLSFAKWLKEHPILLCTGIGITAGLYCGLFGAGGAFLFMFALLLMGNPLHKAVGTSTMVMAFTTASGAVGHAMTGKLPYLVVGGITAGTILGSFGSARIANRLTERTLEKVMAVVVGILGAVVLILPILRS